MAKELTIFYMEGCPYCRNARKAVQELQEANADYASVPLHWIDETKESALADEYPYYRVPSVFIGKTKLYECDPSEKYRDIRDQMEKVMIAALA